MELLVLGVLVSRSACALSFTSLSPQILNKIEPYQISTDCHENYICRESNYFRLDTSAFSQQKNPNFKETKCIIDELYVTLGDQFANPSLPSLYRLGFRISSLACLESLKIKIFEVSPGTGSLSPFQQEESLYEEERRINDQKRKFYVRQYSFHGLVNGQTYSIDRLYVFTDLVEEELPDSGYFGYSFEIDGAVVKGPFIFESKVADYLNGKTQNLEIISFGDHDAQQFGSVTINALNSEDAMDLILLLGDYAYETYDDNGEKGRLYFNELEPVLASQPVLLIPGNHEWFDQFAFFYAKMSFPGDPYLGDAFLFTDVDKDYSFGPDLINSNMSQDLKDRDSHHSYHVLLRDIMIVAVNMEVVLQKSIYFAGFIDRLNGLFDKYNRMSHKIFASHRPLFCSQVKLFKKDCIANYFVLAPLVELLNHFEFNLFMMAHVHYYERMIPLQNFVPIYKTLTRSSQRSILSLASQNTFQNTQMVTSTAIISGSAGCDHYFMKNNIIDIEYLLFNKQKTPGFTSLSFYMSRDVPLVLVRFIPSSSHSNLIPITLRADVPGVFEHHSPLDSVIVLGISFELSRESKWLLYLLLVVTVLMMMGLFYLCRNKFRKSRTKHTERLRLANNYDEVETNAQTSMMDDDQSKTSFTRKNYPLKQEPFQPDLIRN